MNEPIKFSKFKYKDKKYILTENKFNDLSGFRINAYGRICLVINSNLSSRERMLAIHKLISSKGLKSMKESELNFKWKR